jgi:hypothetical protein
VIQLADNSTTLKYLQDARTHATDCLATTATECASLAVVESNWNLLCDAYTALSAEAKAAFTRESADSIAVGVTDIQKWVARYTYIVNKYTTYADPMGLRTSAAINLGSTNTIAEDGSLVAVCAIAGIAIAGGAFFNIHRRKKQA